MPIPENLWSVPAIHKYLAWQMAIIPWTGITPNLISNLQYFIFIRCPGHGRPPWQFVGWSMRHKESGEKTRWSWSWADVSENEWCWGTCELSVGLSNDEAHSVGMWSQWSPLVLTFLKLTGCHRHCCGWQYMPFDSLIKRGSDWSSVALWPNSAPALLLWQGCWYGWYGKTNITLVLARRFRVSLSTEKSFGFFSWAQATCLFFCGKPHYHQFHFNGVE